MSELKHTQIRFWGGLRTIGGTVVTIEYNGARVIFDFGTTYDPASNIFDGQIKKRVTGFVRDHLKLRLIPPIDGIYSAKALGDYPDIMAAEDSELQTAVIISHLHLDHIGAMGTIASAIPVYLSEESKDMYDALEKIGEGVPGKRTYQVCQYDHTFAVGDIQITPIQIDHDIPGACGYHIQTPDGAIVYTGDLRLHGKHPERVHSFIEKVKKLGVDALIMEGTTLRSVQEYREEIIADNTMPDTMITEQNIAGKMAEQLTKTKGLGVFNVYHRNIERLRNVIKAAAETNRQAVFEPATAYLLLRLTDESDFLVYVSEEDEKALKAGTLPEWKLHVLEQFQTISYSGINEQPGCYFLQNTYENVLELFDLNCDGGCYIHSNGVPLGPFDPAFDNLKKIVGKIGLNYEFIGTGGHAIPQHLKYVVDTIDPAILIPLHSFSPERLKPNNGVQFLPDYGVTYTFDDKKIKR